MKDPSLAIQKAVYHRLTTSPAVTAIVGQRVYDDVPADAAFPFIHIGDDDFEPEAYFVRCTVRVNALTRGVGQVDVKRLAAAIQDAFAEPLVLDAPFVAPAHRHIETTYGEDLEHESQLGEVAFEFIAQEDA